MQMINDTFKALSKAYQAGARYSRTKARQEGDGDSLTAYVNAKYGKGNEDLCAMFVAGVYATEKKDFHKANPDYHGNGWFPA